MNATNPDGDANPEAKSISSAGDDADDQALIAENAKLRQALRNQVIYYAAHSHSGWTREGCDQCDRSWPINAAELHAPGCLAALTSEAGDSTYRSSTAAGCDAEDTGALNEKSR